MKAETIEALRKWTTEVTTVLSNAESENGRGVTAQFLWERMIELGRALQNEANRDVEEEEE